MYLILKGFGVGEESPIGGVGNKLEYQSGQVFETIEPAILKNVKEGVDYKIISKEETEKLGRKPKTIGHKDAAIKPKG